MLKLNMLRVISPPLKPPTPGAPPFETRGPIIAIEGAAAAPGVLKEVAAVVEKALSISGECVVRMWNGPNDDDHGDSSRLKSITDQDANGGNTVGPGFVPNNDSQPLPNPMANYIGQMLKWHRTSEEVIKFITANPTRGTSSSITTAAASLPEPASIPTTIAPDTSSSSSSSKVPVAVFGTGYSLAQSDRYAAALPMTDAYQPEDHWKWVATLWRGIVGPDLTIYVKLCQSADEVRGNNCLEFANPAVVMLRVPGTPVASGGAPPTSSDALASAAGTSTTDVHVDERLERRLGFEIMEWVRSGSFRATGGGKKPVAG